MLYRDNSPANDGQADVVRRNLVALGFEPGNIEMRPYSPVGGFPERWDLAANLGWCADGPDPYDLFYPLLYLPDAWNPGQPGVLAGTGYQRKLKAAAKLTGMHRLRALGKLDLEITANVAPYVAMRTYNSRYFFSNRVDPRSLTYSGVYQDWSIPALALK